MLVEVSQWTSVELCQCSVPSSARPNMLFGLRTVTVRSAGGKGADQGRDTVSAPTPATRASRRACLEGVRRGSCRHALHRRGYRLGGRRPRSGQTAQSEGMADSVALPRRACQSGLLVSTRTTSPASYVLSLILGQHAGQVVKSLG
jgi:hypothetical protein